ncbi:MAG: M23 family metallopeptidase [Candidatus Paceibacterota bacterium]
MQSKLTKGSKISLFLKSYTIKAYSLFILISFIVGIPLQANAGFFDFFTGATEAKTADANTSVNGADDFGTDDFSKDFKNSQNVPLLESSIDPDMKNADNETNISTEGGMLSTGDSLFGTGIESDSRGEMTVYEVKDGDTLSEIAALYDISVNTIKWENNLTTGSIKVGQKLNILPMTGVKHIVKKGDTLEKIALKYDAEVEDIKVFNDIVNNNELKQGDTLYIPNGIIKPVVIVEKPYTIKKPVYDGSSTPIVNGYYMRPASGRITSPYGSRKGAFHYGIDIGSPRGTSVIAAAQGTVIEVLGSCKEGKRSCGGRYGNYIVVAHPNGTTTRYAHLSKVYVSVGDNVTQGERIGAVGNTGRSTGPHLHFEIEKASGAKMRPVF